MRFTSGRRVAPTMDLTPLIDVIFQLLLFFILSTTFKNSPSFEVDLPQVSSDQMIMDDNTWTLTVGADGRMVAVDREVEQDQLLELLKEQVSLNPELSLMIEADETLTHGSVVKIMDVAQEAGIVTVQIGAVQQ